MNKEEQVQNFLNYQSVLHDILEKGLQEWKEKDFVSLWISHINFGLRCERIRGGFEYDTRNLKYGPYSKKLYINQLNNCELEEIVNFYWAKGYTLNRIGDVVTSNPELIVINWEKPRKQTFEDKKSLFVFKISKLKKFYKFYRKKYKYNVFFSCLVAVLYFYAHFYENDSYCLNAQKQYRISKKHEKRMERLKKKSQQSQY